MTTSSVEFDKLHLVAPTVSVRRIYCLLFTILSVNVPGFLEFDSTNRTHDYGLINAQSLSRILLTFVITATLMWIWWKQAAPLILRRLKGGRYLAFCLIYFLALSLAWPINQVALSIFRLGEWTLLYLLVAALYSRISPARASSYVIKVIVRMAAIPALIVLVALPLAPSVAYRNLDEVTGIISGRLGGRLFLPNGLASMLSIVYFYFFLLKSGWRRAIGMVITALLVLLTYSRAGVVGLVVGTLIFFFLYANWFRRMTAIGVCLIGGLTATAYLGTIVQFLGRGNDADNISTLSERATVWAASWQMFLERPFSGYGYISGPKEWLGIYVAATHWNPSNAHNEFIQSLLEAGLFGFVLVVLFYLRLLHCVFRLKFSSRENGFFAAVLFTSLIASSMSPALTGPLNMTGAILLLLGVHLFNYPDGNHFRCLEHPD